MAKPSIFSREYKRRMKKRKRNVAMIFVIIIAASGIMFSSGYVKGWFEKGISAVKNNKNDARSLLTGKNNEQIASNEDKKQENVPTENKGNENIENKPQENVPEAEKYFEAMIAENKVIKVVYEESNEGRRIKNIKDESNLYYNISPNGKNMITWDAPSQIMMLIDAEGKVKDITKPSYKTKNTGSVIQRENQLVKRPTYIWCSTPKFINDDTIAYVTNLPLISKNNQFIWVYDMTKEDHTQIYSKTSNSIIFKDLVEGKLAIDIDGSQKYILPDRKISN